MNDWQHVATALLGSWPSQVTSWGREAIAAYCSELEARGVTPDAAVVAIRSCPAGQKFPPSAPELAGLARQDPGRPTFDELLAQLYGPGGVFGFFRRNGVTVSPWVLEFVRQQGEQRLRLLPIDDDVEGKWVRRQLEQSWQAFCEASEGREVSQIARSGRTGLGRPDLAGMLERGPGA